MNTFADELYATLREVYADLPDPEETPFRAFTVEGMAGYLPSITITFDLIRKDATGGAS